MKNLSSKNILLIAGLAAASLMGNIFNLPLLFSVAIIFGSIFSLIAVRLFGIIPALIISAVSGFYTYYLWNHPYAMIIFILETAFAGITLKKFKHLPLTDGIFWALIGIPMVLIFYRGFMNMDWSAVFLIALKQPINGIFNAVIAEIIILFLVSNNEKFKNFSKIKANLETLLFNIILVTCLVVGMSPVIINSHKLHGKLEEDVAEHLYATGNAVKFFLHKKNADPQDILANIIPGKHESIAVLNDNNEIISGRGTIRTLSGEGSSTYLQKNLNIWRPTEEMPSMNRFRNGQYYMKLKAASDSGNMTILIEEPAFHIIEEIEKDMLLSMMLLIAITAVSLLAAKLISNMISSPIIQLNLASADLENRISKGEHLQMPGSYIDDFDRLSSSIQNMSASLSENFLSINRMKNSLEEQIQERTQNLREQESFFREITENLTEFLHRFDADFKTTYINPAMAYTMGINPSDLIGKSWLDFLSAEDQLNVIENFKILTPENPGFHMENKIFDYQKNERVILWNNRAFFSEDGRITSYQATGQDITERNKYEKELINAKNEAEEANIAKSQFLSNMSHELRTPLNAILGFAQLFEIEKGLKQNQISNIKEIIHAGHHLLELINEVLDLSKIESGHIEMNMESIHFDELMSECMTLINPMLKSNNITIHKKYPENFYLHADKIRLKQVLINLLSNAVKYNCQNGSIIIEAETAGDDFIKIKVSDTGIGVPAGKINELFQPFSRLADENLNIDGTGIGLAISKKIIDLMGGNIGYEAGKISGSVFWIELLKVSSPSPELNAETEYRISSLSPSSFHIKKVIYIEDNPVNLRLITGLFIQRPQYHLLTAQNPSMGYELILSHKPDLILLDIGLPEMDGYELLSKIRSQEKCKDIPVIAVTAFTGNEDIAMGQKAGFNEYLTKPINISHFFETIDFYLENKTVEKVI